MTRYPSPAAAASNDLSGFTLRVLVVAGVVGLAVAFYKLATILLLIFASVVAATAITALADPVSDRLGASRTISIVAAIAAIVALAGGVLFLFGRELVDQIGTLTDELPKSFSSLRGWLSSNAFFREFSEIVSNAGGDSAGAILSSLRTTIGNLVAVGVYLLIVLAAGVMLAVSPETYRDGLLTLAPKTARPRLRNALNASGAALRGWLVGQLTAMAIIGVFTSAGLYLVGTPSWLALGVLAGLAQFVPLVGPTLSSIPGFLVALTIGPQQVLWTAFVYFGVQQTESNLITPFVMRKATNLPMALTLFSIVGIGLLFGPLGVILATPLTVVAYVLVRMLYVEDVIGENDAAPFEKTAKSESVA